MDKRTLNNEIILCRPYVRKARVAVIRKILKKIKILKSCKIEALKKKKADKSERLFKKVQILKKLKEDEVTRFGLENKDVNEILKKPKLNLKTNALASLAKHCAVLEKINAIREKIPNWEQELPALLNSLGKRKKMLGQRKKENSPTKSEEQAIALKSLSRRTTSDSVKNTSKKVTKNPDLVENESSRDEKEELNWKPIEAQKIKDPFFIEKQVIAPKLLSQNTFSSLSNENLNKTSFNKFAYSNLSKGKRVDSNKAIQTRQTSYQTQEKLHPSWAAKKLTLIKPFQGKKIIFSND